MTPPLPYERSARYEEVEEFFRLGPTGVGDQDSERVGEDFGRIEEEFGRALDESLAPRGPDSLDDLLAGTDPPRGGVAVDVGCGRGRDAVRLAARFDLHVHGIDPAPSNVEKARRRAAEDGLDDRIDLHLGRAEAIPLPDASVDALWCKEVLTFTDLDAAMREFRRVLRPGGVGVIYQVLTGPTLSAAEAGWLAEQEMGFGQARNLRPADVEEAITAAGLELRGTGSTTPVNGARPDRNATAAPGAG